MVNTKVGRLIYNMMCIRPTCRLQHSTSLPFVVVHSFVRFWNVHYHPHKNMGGVQYLSNLLIFIINISQWTGNWRYEMRCATSFKILLSNWTGHERCKSLDCCSIVASVNDLIVWWTCAKQTISSKYVLASVLRSIECNITSLLHLNLSFNKRDARLIWQILFEFK